VREPSFFFCLLRDDQSVSILIRLITILVTPYELANWILSPVQNKSSVVKPSDCVPGRK